MSINIEIIKDDTCDKLDVPNTLSVFKEDIFCNEIGKTVSSIVDGPVLEEYLIERM